MKSASSRRISSDRVKYTAVKSSERSVDKKLSEKSPLLENVEKLSISSAVQSEQTSSTGAVTLRSPKSQAEKDVSGKVEADENSVTEDNNGTDVNNEISGVKDSNLNGYQGARPKNPTSQISTSGNCGGSNGPSIDNKLDIVRKMSQPIPVNRIRWRVVGPYQTLKLNRCQRLHAESRRADDLALFFHNGRFYAIEAWCSHMGGPLFEGDIEDYNGKCHVMCPWHSYMFDLETGKNEIGLQQKVHELKLEHGLIYVRYHTDVSTSPLRKTSESIINRPPEGKHEKMRKESVLDTPLKLVLP